MHSNHTPESRPPTGGFRWKRIDFSFLDPSLDFPCFHIISPIHIPFTVSRKESAFALVTFVQPKEK